MIRAGVVNRLILVFLVSSFNVAYAEDCTSWVAKAISIQGDVERRSNTDQSTSQWQSIKRDDQLCAGEIIRVKQNSRAALILKNDTILRLNQNTTITLSSLSEDQSHWINLEQGIAHFIARIKQSFKVITPFVNAAVEGTEFVVSVNTTQSEVTVFEGKVNVNNDLGEVKLTKGQTAITEDKSKPTLTLKIKPRDAVQWSLYYPVIINLDSVNYQNLDSATKTIMTRSIAAAHDGHFNTALTQFSLISSTEINSNLLTYRASLYLSVGQIENANNDIKQVIQKQPDNADAIALQAIMAIVQNDKTKALSLAEHAITLAPVNATTSLALSYVHQSLFDINSALEVIKTATSKNKDNALLWSRLSELYLMTGDLNKALEAATKANKLNPNIARTHSALGFAYLSKIEVKKAQQAFNDAIKLNDSDPLSRLGLGLAVIRQGNLAGGRREIEYATTLDPNNALIRSYLGKAYYEEKRDKLAAVQFEMAKHLDPNDPTAYFYDAIRKQTNQQYRDALKDLQSAIKLNDNKSIYRSKLFLDQDMASKNLNRGQLYNAIGYKQLAIKNAANSIDMDPLNYSAHKFLANMYLHLPRHEISVVSEVMQSQILQPIILNTAQPQATETNLGLISNIGESGESFNNYYKLFEKNDYLFSLNNSIGSNNTRADNVGFSQVYNRFTYNIGYFRFKSDGYRKNNDQSQTIKSTFMQYAFTHNFSVQYEFKDRDYENGDIIQKFGINNFDETLRETTRDKTNRVSINSNINVNNNLIFSYYNRKINYLNTTNDAFFFDTLTSNTDGDSIEVQHIFTSKKLKTITGIGESKQDVDRLLITDDNFFPPFTLLDDEFKIKNKNAYIYIPYNMNKNNNILVGLSYDQVKHPKIVSNNKINPKLGYTYKDTDTTFRIGVFKTLKRPLISNQTIEPTQISGFNQFFDDTTGTEATRFGLGLDYTFSNNTYFGAEITKRDVTRYFLSTATGVNKEESNEYLHRAYYYWTPYSTMTLNIEYVLEDFEREYNNKRTNNTKPAILRTEYVPVSLKLFYSNGLYASLTSTYISQEVSFTVKNQALNDLHDSFNITDFAIGYLFNQSKHSLSIGVKNLFDTKFEYQNTNPNTSQPRDIQYYPEKFVYGNIRLSF